MSCFEADFPTAWLERFMYIEKTHIGEREFILEGDCIRIISEKKLGDGYSLTYDYSSISKNPSEQYIRNPAFSIFLWLGAFSFNATRHCSHARRGGN